MCFPNVESTFTLGLETKVFTFQPSFKFFFFVLFFFFFAFYYIIFISTYLLKIVLLCFCFIILLIIFLGLFIWEEFIFYELKVQYRLWLIRSFGVYAYCICICQGHIIAFTKSYCFKIHSQNTSRVYQLVNVYGLI